MVFVVYVRLQIENVPLVPRKTEETIDGSTVLRFVLPVKAKVSGTRVPFPFVVKRSDVWTEKSMYRSVFQQNYTGD